MPLRLLGVLGLRKRDREKQFRRKSISIGRLGRMTEGRPLLDMVEFCPAISAGPKGSYREDLPPH